MLNKTNNNCKTNCPQIVHKNNCPLFPSFCSNLTKIMFLAKKIKFLVNSDVRNDHWDLQNTNFPKNKLKNIFDTCNQFLPFQLLISSTHAVNLVKVLARYHSIASGGIYCKDKAFYSTHHFFLIYLFSILTTSQLSHNATQAVFNVASEGKKVTDCFFHNAIMDFITIIFCYI